MRASKRAKRAFKRARLAVRNAIASHSPPVVTRTLGPAVRYIDMLVLDHVVIRTVFPNRHRVSNAVWRAAQPLPHQIGSLKRLGIRTIVNLRGEHKSATYALEKAACERHGIAFVDYRIRSRAAPTREEILGAVSLLEHVRYPILMHCKSGADRVGLMSALYRHVRDGEPIAEAKSELALRYGHIRQADTGVLDYFFERYLADAAREPIGFLDWVATVYDPAELKRSFRAQGWANRLVDGLLRRE